MNYINLLKHFVLLAAPRYLQRCHRAGLHPVEKIGQKKVVHL